MTTPDSVAPSVLCVALAPAVDTTLLFVSGTDAETARADESLVVAGGKAANVARALARLDCDAVLLAAIGGPTGALFESLARREDFTSSFVPVAHETRLCTICTDARGASDVYTSGAPGIDRAEWDEIATAVDLLATDVDAVCLSGVVPDATSSADVDRLVGTVEARDAQLWLDVSSDRALPTGMIAGLKVNAAEAATLAGRSSASGVELLAAAEELLDLARTVIVTDAKRGCIAVDRDGGAWSAQLDAGSVQNPIGAGDTFLASYLSSALRGGALVDSLRVATATAGASVCEWTPRWDQRRARMFEGLARVERIY